MTSEGERQVLGVDVGPSEDRALWTAFLRGLVKRGLRGAKPVISDAHVGLKQAIATDTVTPMDGDSREPALL